MKDFFEKLDKANVIPVFGLEAQGHIPAIEEILNDLGSCDYAWEKIAKHIGWCDKAARNHYITYLMERGQKDSTRKSGLRLQSVMPSLHIFKERRKKLNMTLREVARITKVSAATISRIERAQGECSYHNVVQLDDFYCRNGA